MDLMHLLTNHMVDKLRFQGCVFFRCLKPLSDPLGKAGQLPWLSHGFPTRHPYRFRMEEERAAVRAVLHFGAKDDTSDDNAARGEAW